MSLDTPVSEARRQIEICNACRYCEGYCSVFPAITRQKAFADGDITQLANLCHNCRGCYYACQYTEPHEFALNLPAALAEVRVESWERLIRPHGFSRLFSFVNRFLNFCENFLPLMNLLVIYSHGGHTVTNVLQGEGHLIYS